MLYFIFGACSGLFIYRMGILIGRKQAEEEFDEIRKQMDLDTERDAWNFLYYGDKK